MNTFMYHLSIDKETDIIVNLQVQKSHATFLGGLHRQFSYKYG